MDRADDRNATANTPKAPAAQTADQALPVVGEPASRDEAERPSDSRAAERPADRRERPNVGEAAQEETRTSQERSGSTVATAERQNGDPNTARSGGLVDRDRAQNYRHRWTSIQAVFVDEPRDSVQQADALVEELMHDLTETFGSERARLEQQWSSGEEVSTEQLRIALQRYRTFFEQLLSA